MLNFGNTKKIIQGIVTELNSANGVIIDDDNTSYRFNEKSMFWGKTYSDLSIGANVTFGFGEDRYGDLWANKVQCVNIKNPENKPIAKDIENINCAETTSNEQRIGLGNKIDDITDYVFIDFNKHIDKIKPLIGLEIDTRGKSRDVLKFVTDCFNTAVTKDKVKYVNEKAFFPIYGDKEQSTNEYGELIYFQTSRSIKPEIDTQDPKGRKHRKWQGIWIVSSNYIDSLFELPVSDDAKSVSSNCSMESQREAYNLKDCLRQDDGFIASVKELAMKEYWGQKDEVLLNYLEYTYLRLVEEKKTIKTDDGIVFNTGLLDISLNELYLLIVQNSNGEFEKLDLIYDDDVRAPNTKLELAKYFEELQDVIFDAFQDVKPVYHHIFESLLKDPNRIPVYSEKIKESKDDSVGLRRVEAELKQKIKEALKKSQSLAKRNFKYAIPQYNIKETEYQFMLPLFLDKSNSELPDCVLVLRKAKDGKKYYEGITILSLDMAYNNARQLSRPDVYWLRK
ncbi:MAG: DUF3825 domain-containing protein [Oscillospiraceae bacterium]|nr:DUF3825 domain-containing protein [Oscillospiraceae bacterium]